MPDNESPTPAPQCGATGEEPAPKKAERKQKPRRIEDPPSPASPAAAGPAGALLEGHVGAQYLLPLLSGGEARGLPGVVITRVAFQRAGLGHPMDDVVVTGTDSQGRAATLELQAKRTITFTAADPVFKDVVALACQAAAKPEFETTRYELAVAVARTSTKIEQHVQEVLKWARNYQDAEGFFHRLNQPGVTHQAMRDFVAAFRDHMRAVGAAHDDAAVWRLLSRFQVLAFDFEQPGSTCAQLARERAAFVLASADAGRASQFWDSLQQIALEVDATGGDLDAPGLRERLIGERGYRLAGDRRMHGAREWLAEAAENTLAAITSTVHGVQVDRSDAAAVALDALDHGRYLEIRGAGGVGKSGVLKDLAQRIGVESRIVIVAPHRVPGGGWTALKAQLGCDATARELLTDLAGDGGGILFVDGLDRFDDPGQRATVADLLRSAAQVRGFLVVATTRLDFDADARAWLPTHALRELGAAPPLVIDELSEDEVTYLRKADPALATLLQPGHPAQKLVRNLYRLDRLAHGASTEHAATFSEAQMARQWWETGDGVEATGRLGRRRVLRSLAIHSLNSSAPMDTSALPTEAIAALIGSDSLRALGAVRAEPVHDVLRDWAIGCLLYEEPERFAALALTSPAPARLVRGVEMAARLHAEFGQDVTGWRALLDQVSVLGMHGSWRRAVLLAPARSERSAEALNRCLSRLDANDALLLAEIVRATIVADSQPATPLWATLGVDTSKLTDDFVLPRGPAWLNLIVWSLATGNRLPPAAVPQLVDLYGRWCNAFAGQDACSPLLVKCLHAWLVEVEATSNPKTLSFEARTVATAVPRLTMTTSQESDLRMAFLSWCKLCPAETASYLQDLAAHPHRHVVFRKLLPFLGTAAYAAPQALADLFLQALPEGDSDDEDRNSSRDTFSHWDLEYLPASPARPPFFDLLQANKEHGLRLIRGVVEHAVRRRTHNRKPCENQVHIPFPGGTRAFPWRRSYVMSRSDHSYIVASALMALEAWAHRRIEQGEPIQDVVNDVLGPEGSPAAHLLVAIDVMLSHWPESRGCLWPFAASAELLALDRERYAYDQCGNVLQESWIHPEPSGTVKLEDLRRRLSRKLPLDAVLPHFALSGAAEVRESMQHALRDELARIGMPGDDSPGMTDPSFVALNALNRLDAANYVSRGESASGEAFEYIAPIEETRRFAHIQQRSEHGYTEVVLLTQITHKLTEMSCPVALLDQGVHWATRDASEVQTPPPDADEQEMIDRAKLIVATLVMRDGSVELKASYGEWAQAQLAAAAIREPEDRGFAKALPYNPPAIAAVGFLAVHRHEPKGADLANLLKLAAQHTTDIAAVLRAEVAAKRPLDPELTRSLVRLALTSTIYAVRQRNEPDTDSVDDYQTRHQASETARKHSDQIRLQSAIEAEQRWLARQGPEPEWPELPDPNPPRARRGIRIGGAQVQLTTTALQASPRATALDHAGAAGVLSLAVDLWRVSRSDLLGTLVRHCWPWTAGANGVGCGRDEEPGERVFEWNHAYFRAALAAAVSCGEDGIEKYVLDPLAQLPEVQYLSATEAVLHALDQLWLGDHAVSDDTAVSLHEALAQRLQATSVWRRLAAERSSSIDTNAAGAVAATFMGEHVLGQGPRCYVLPLGAARADQMLPTLAQLAEQTAGSTFVALAFLGLLEVRPTPSQLTSLSRVVAAWWRAQGANAEFWVNYAIGRRLCDWVEKALLNGNATCAVLDSAELMLIVDTLMQCGIPMARELEERLAARRNGENQI